MRRRGNIDSMSSSTTGLVTTASGEVAELITCRRRCNNIGTHEFFLGKFGTHELNSFREVEFSFSAFEPKSSFIVSKGCILCCLKRS